MRKLHKKLNIAVILLLAAALLCACGKKDDGPAVPEPTAPPAPSQTPVATPAPTPKPAPAPTSAPAATPEPRAERVEDDYFADAAFFGNSLVDGLHRFGGLSSGDFFANTSASVISVEVTQDAKRSDGSSATMLEALLEKQYQKIYVLFGINELGYNLSGFIDLYAGVLETVREGEPDATIFVMSLTPITEQRSKAGDVFTKERVEEFNAAIKAMAEERGYVYLDLFDALSNKNGYLPKAHSSDGIHFSADGYRDWAEYMRLNYDGAADVTFYKDEAPDVVYKPPVTTPQPQPTPTQPPEETARPASGSDLG